MSRCELFQSSVSLKFRVMRDDSLGDGVSEAGHGPATRWSERDKSFMKVLVADDDPTSRTLLRRLLIRDYDCAVTEVENGLEALTQLDRQHFSVLLLDVQMPVMGGLEALEAIRGSSHSSLPVVMLTAERGETVVKKAVGLGITDYLIKPLKPNWVGERLAQVMHSLVSDAGAPPDGDASPRISNSRWWSPRATRTIGTSSWTSSTPAARRCRPPPAPRR